MQQFEITSEFIANVKNFVDEGDNASISKLLGELHHADIAEILDELNFEQSIYIIRLLDSDITSEIIAELDEDVREKVLRSLSSKEIAEEIDELETDDAADIIAELPEAQKEEVIAQLEDVEKAKDIVDLLRYNEDTAGGLMRKELIAVRDSWTVLHCVKEMRKQAEAFEKVHTIYVVNDDGILKGRLSLKSLLTTSTKTPISEIFNPKITSVKVEEDDEEVAKIMQKYDLIVVPVIDEMGRLMGQITIDDVVDVIREEADKDYQLAAGITQDVEASDSIFELTKARLPWLFLGLIGGVGAFLIMEGFKDFFKNYAVLFFFTPLIAAMAGNVGVQSSAIIVQGLANNDVKGSINNRLIKEMLLATLNGIILALFLFAFVWGYEGDPSKAFAISVSLVAVIIVAGLVGTFIPLFLNKRGIDPAIATGPFITTSNDIFGILIYFWIAKMILGI
ncbi:magnesium transporter [Pseudofulvibacter geojedonensis]|uniref:Magnesium transporter MgtE n=1 Tax=Pseudofulvibacter geojedonensis TaxID=1123758 RepID=A0ABW3I3B3_9FLAO